MAQQESRLLQAFDELRRNAITRREFMARAIASGAAAPLALILVNSIGMEGAAAQDALSERPSFGTNDQIRGAGGELRVRQYSVPNNLFVHQIPGESNPFAAWHVSSLIVEPLFSYGPDGSLLPTLAAKVPTRENGGLSEDLRTITLELQNGVLWSDGEPFTADDVVWTWQWINDESNASVWSQVWTTIQSVEAISPTKVQFIYVDPSLAWFFPLAGSEFGGILPSHLWRGRDKGTVNAEFRTKLVGTGPYRIDEFVQDDYIVCSINELYREPNKPFFKTVRFQGGGDSASDAQAVLQDGDGDVAPLLFIDPEILLPMESATGTGKLIASAPTSVERIAFNFSDPNTEVAGERSNVNVPHPFLTDIRVRQAMAMAIDRESIANEIFLGDDLHPVALNILTGIPALESPNTSYEFNIDAANDLLDDAGWVREGDTRIKDGMQLAVSYYTAVGEDNSLVKRFRPQIQEAVKAGWEAIGIKVELGQIKGDIFFDTSPENEHSFAHFYRDIEMWADGPWTPFPDLYFEVWYAGPDNSNVAQRANDWGGFNLQRYLNPEFDAMYEEVRSTIDPERAVELFIAMNDLIVNDFVVVPLVARPQRILALSNRIAPENVGASSWEGVFWNIANWRTVEE